MTYPLIGNYGRIHYDDQSERPWLRGLIVANATAAVLDDARQLAALLRDHGIPAIAGVDTRALARHLRANGCLRGIVTAPGETDPDAARAAAAAVPRWDQDFVGQVSPPSITEYEDPGDTGPRIGIVDLGLKNNIVRAMRFRGARVRVFPHTASASGGPLGGHRWRHPLAGPGGPCRLGAQVALARAIIDDGRPLRGSASVIRSWAAPRAPTPVACASAITAPNHPVHDVEMGLVQVTAQNHKVQVVGDSLPAGSGAASPGQPQRPARWRGCAIARPCPSCRPSSATRRASPGPAQDALCGLRAVRDRDDRRE